MILFYFTEHLFINVCIIFLYFYVISICYEYCRICPIDKQHKNERKLMIAEFFFCIKKIKINKMKWKLNLFKLMYDQIYSIIIFLVLSA